MLTNLKREIVANFRLNVNFYEIYEGIWRILGAFCDTQMHQSCTLCTFTAHQILRILASVKRKFNAPRPP